MRRFLCFLSNAQVGRFHTNKIETFLLAKSSRIQDVWSFSPIGNTFSSSRLQQSHFSTFENSLAHVPFTRNIGKENEEKNRLEVEIMSTENIKPATPTPHYLKMYEVSILDQVIPKNMYSSCVYFYQNDHTNNNDIISEKRQLLKQSLSETLTKFYQLAGRVHNDRYIDCNDHGVYYVEAKVSECLSDFSNKPDNESIRQLLPLLVIPYMTMIQVTIFGCGSIAIGLYVSHKIIDGYSLMTFLKAWGATTAGFPEEICPSFISPSIFLPIPTFSENLSTKMEVMPVSPRKQNKYATRRFVFSASSLVDLKKKAGDSSSRVKAVMGLIWKCAISASLKLKPSTSKPYIMRIPVNLRNICSPPLPKYTIGNIFWGPYAQCARNDDLHSLVAILNNATDQINSDFVEKLKGEQGSHNIIELLTKILSSLEDEYMVVSSVCNGGMYEVDFGWGKPIWASVGLANPGLPIVEKIAFLTDTKFLNGIEACVTLGEDEMTVFEQDSELLEFASLNPSPLQNVA